MNFLTKNENLKENITIEITEIHNIQQQTKTIHTEIYYKEYFLIGYSKTEKVKPY